MSHSNKILFLAIILVWIPIVFKYETFFNGVDGKGGHGGGGSSSRGGTRSGHSFRFFGTSSGTRVGSLLGLSSNSHIRRYSSNSNYNSRWFWGKSLPSSYGTKKLKNEADNKMKILAAKILIAGAIVPAVGSVFFQSSNSYAYKEGYYYKYNYREDSSINGSICINNQTYDGIIYGQFVCPIEGFKPEDIECCGTIGEHYCCSLENNSYGFILGIIVIICGLLVLVGFVGYNMYYNFLFNPKKDTGEPLLN